MAILYFSKIEGSKSLKKPFTTLRIENTKKVKTEYDCQIVKI